MSEPTQVEIEPEVGFPRNASFVVTCGAYEPIVVKYKWVNPNLIECEFGVLTGDYRDLDEFIKRFDQL